MDKNRGLGTANAGKFVHGQYLRMSGKAEWDAFSSILSANTRCNTL
jgi:hypothetical protein